MDQQQLERWMRLVVDHAWQGCANNQSPFAAAIVTLDGERLAIETNTVALSNQPSRHGEVNAIDAACRSIGRVQLPEVWLISSGEPCPMCAAAAAIAGVKHIAFGAYRKTIEQAGYETLGLGLDDFLQNTTANIEFIGGIEEEACRRLLLENRK
jgi:tRNA(Arg) A34 adenosine deaminase TadA